MATEEEKKETSGASGAEAKDASAPPEGYKFLVSEPDFQAQFGLGAPLFDYSLPDFVEKKSDILEQPPGNNSISSPASLPSLPSASAALAQAAPAIPESSYSSSSSSSSLPLSAPFSAEAATEAFTPSYFASGDFSFAPSAPFPSCPQAVVPNIPALSLPVLLSLTPSDFPQPLIALSQEQQLLALQIFEKADINANGFLEPEELKLALVSNNFSASQKTVLTLIKSVIDRVLVKRSATDIPGGGEVLTSPDDFCLALASEYSRGAFNVREQRSLSTPVQEQFYRLGEAGARVPENVNVDGNRNVNVASRGTANVNESLPVRQTNFRPELYGNGGVPTAAVRVRAVALNSTSDPYFAAIIASLVSLAPRTVACLLKENIDKSCDVVFNKRFDKGITVVPPSVSDVMRYGFAFEYGYWFLVLDKAYGIYLATKSRLATKLGEASGSFCRAGEAMQAVLAKGVEALVVSDLDDERLMEKIRELGSKSEPLVVVSSNQAAPYLPLYRDNFPYAVVGFNPQKKAIQVYCLPFIGSPDEMQKAREMDSKLFVWLTLNDFRKAFRALYLPVQNGGSSASGALSWLRGK